jgi:hypothetical protein
VDAGAPATLSVEALMDPASCKECHAEHYAEWSGSMHAYASADPVFEAMNRRGQEATQGALGDFCIKCHAPLAVKLGLTTDGLNLQDVPAHLRGITCFYCHSVDGVEGTHNNGLQVSLDGVMRGGFEGALENTGHRSRFSALHARDSLESATLCGSCHDIVTPSGLELERTFQEWGHALYSRPGSQALTCNACHMDGRDGVAATVPNAPPRRVHAHAWPGVDVALTDFPNAEAQRAAVQLRLDTTLLPQLCVLSDATLVDLQVSLENIAAGHAFPSGAAQDRRVWVEVVARRNGAVVFQSGVAEAGEDVTHLGDPNLWLIRDRLFDADGVPTHLFWAAATYETNLLPPPTARTPADPGWTQIHRTRSYSYLSSEKPDTVELRVHVQPVGVDVLRDLVATGYLDAAVVDRMPTFTLAAGSLTWRASDGVACVGATGPRP